MPLEQLPFRVEDFQSGPLGKHRYYYLYDPTSGKWLSTHMETFPCGRNATNYTGFLRMVNGIAMSSTRGYIPAHAATLVGFVASSDTAGAIPAEQNIDIYDAGGVVHTEAFNGYELNRTLDIDISGPLAVEIRQNNPASSPEQHDRPLVQLYWRWRLD